MPPKEAGADARFDGFCPAGRAILKAASYRQTVTRMLKWEYRHSSVDTPIFSEGAWLYGMTILPFTLSNDDISTTSLPCEYAIHTVHGTFPSHRHDCLELSLVIGGLGREIVNEAEHVMQPFSAKRRA